MSHIKIVYANALGWREQAGLLHRIAAASPSPTEVTLIPYNSPKFLRIFLKDTYGKGLPRRLNLLTSISVAKSALSKNVVRFQENDNVIFMGGNLLGLLAHAPDRLSPIVISDMTSSLASRLFGAKTTSKDMEEERSFFVRCRKIFAMSTACARSFIDDYGISPDKVDLYLPPVQAGPRTQPSPGGRVRVGFVGGDFARKGGHQLLEAFKTFSLARHCDLIIVSEKCGPINEPNITVHGRLPHDKIISDILPNIDIFCLPTLQDCSGLAIAEALSAGLPVIVTDLPGIADLVSHEETGVVVPPNRAAPIGEAIERLAGDPDFRMRLSRQALAFAEANFSAEKRLDRLLTEFR